MSYPVKEILKNFFAVMTGLFVALIIIIPIFLFGAYLGIGDEKLPESQIIISDVIMILGLASGSIIGGYLTAKIATKNESIHVLITGIVLNLFYFINADIGIDQMVSRDYFSLIAISGFLCLGCYLANRKKNRRSNNP
jgi:hypothetical protein